MAEPVPTSDMDGRAGPAVVAALPASRTEPFAMVGLTWDPATTPVGLNVEARVRTTAGWSGWEHLEHVADEGPTAGEDADVRAGTAPLWVGDADGVAVRVESADGTAPSGLQLVTVDPGAADPDAAGLAAGRTVAKRHPRSGQPIGRAPEFPGLPRVIDRRQWGADPGLSSRCSTPRYGNSAKAVFVHHTAGSSRYSVRESPAVVRSVYAYHTQAQRWCDIGYNALIDRFGNIYVGRRGGIRKPVRGAHAGEVNTNSSGVSLMGNFVRRAPSKPMINALVRFTGWRLGTSFAPPRSRTRIGGDRHRRISGHRDAMSTACPGRRVYDRLPRIRARVDDYLSAYDSRTERKADRLGKATTGRVFIGERWVGGGTRTQFGKGRIYYKRGFGANFLSGRVIRRFNQTRGLEGPLGWPRSELQPARVRGVRLVVFRDGRMYVDRRRQPQVLFGRILDRYRKMNFTSSRLGLPHTSVHGVRGGQRAVFQHGRIRWDRSADTTRVVLR